MNTLRAQQALIKLGYDIGKADDVFGPKTLAGMMALVSGRQVSDVIHIAQPLFVRMTEFGIYGQYRIAHFLANLSHESQRFHRLAENLTYTDAARLLDIFPSRIKDMNDAKGLVRAGAVAIGNRVYAEKNGNGDEASGDGSRFKGRGLIGTTGRKNYTRLVSPMDLDVVGKPELLEKPEHAAHAACIYWDDNRLNLLADKNDTKRIRVAINGERALGLSECVKGASKIIALFHP